jgi:hypothetical protein
MHHPTFVIVSISIIIVSLIYLLYIRNCQLELFNNPPLKIYLHGFWNNNDIGDYPKQFLKEVCEAAFNCQCSYGAEHDSDIIIQSVFVNDTELLKKFKYRIFYTGENWKNENPDLYDVLLGGENTENKYVSVPLFLLSLPPHEYESLTKIQPRTDVPEKDVIVIISNAGGEVRNKFLTELDKHFNVTYAGSYKNNIGGKLSYKQGTPEYKTYLSQYKYVITMENSEAPHYLTEKILQGLQSQIIPIYWGASEASQYINKDRFIQMKDGSDDAIRSVIEQMKTLSTDPEKWLEIVNKPVFARKYGSREIGELMRKVLDNQQS